MENPPIKSAPGAFGALIALVESLRGAHGCPWDKKQTPRSMLVFLIEEIYELADAIESGSPSEVCEELCDVLFHIFFIARLFEEMGHFSIHDIARGSTEKMIRRHPHVFGTTKVDDSDEVKQNWHKIKQKEKKLGQKDSALDSVPVTLPALMRAYKISGRAARTGFDWNNMSGVLQKMEEELAELKLALNCEDTDQAAQEFGDVLFTLVNVGRFAKIHPETALSGSIKKFEKRFKLMEKRILESGRDLEAVSQTEKDLIWDETRKIIK